MKKFSVLLLALGVLSSFSIHAGGYSSKATPTGIEIDRDNGIMVFGAFGNPAGCTQSDRFYVAKAHPQYDKVYAMLLAAYAAKKKIGFYGHDCIPVLWYSNNSVTYNQLISGGSISISD